MRRLGFTSAVTAVALFVGVHSSIQAQTSDEQFAMLTDDPGFRHAMATAASVIPPDQATSDIARLAGEYSFGNGFDLTCTLVISPDGRFAYRLCSCETVVDEATGQVHIVNGQLVMQTDRTRKEWPRGISSVMTPVTWGQRLYLVPQNDYLGYTNEINRGVEPISHGSMGHYFLREGDWDRPAEGKPALPPEWQERLLSQPVMGVVAGKDPTNRWIINLGQQDGIYNGMELSAWSPDLRRFVTVIVTETGYDTSAIQVVSPPVDAHIAGWTVYSRIAPPGRENTDRSGSPDI